MDRTMPFRQKLIDFNVEISKQMNLLEQLYELHNTLVAIGQVDSVKDSTNHANLSATASQLTASISEMRKILGVDF